MIKKLRNQPYAPKMGASSQVGAKGSKKKLTTVSIVQMINEPELCGSDHVLT
jgi:hypothetical protein